MQERGDLDLIEIFIRNIQLPRNANGPLRQPGAVNSCIEVLKIEKLVECANHRVAQSNILLFQLLHPQQCRCELEQLIGALRDHDGGP